MAITFNGADLSVHFKENVSNGAERQYKLEYVCGTKTVTHYKDQADFDGVNQVDGMRLYSDVLTYAENLAAGLTRSPKVKFYTQDASGEWSEPLLIEAYNPAPDVPACSRVLGYDWVNLTLDTPDDTDFAGFVVWADTQTPVRRNSPNTTIYQGPNTSVQLQLAPDTDYWVEYGAYDKFGFAALNTATIHFHTLSEASILLPYLNGAKDELTGEILTATAAVDKAAKAYGDKAFEATQTFQSGVDSLNNTFAEEKTRVNSRFEDAAAGIEEVKKTVTGANESVAKLEESVIAKFKDTEGAINDLKEVVSDGDNSLAKQVTTVTSRLNGENAGGVTIEQRLQTNADKINGYSGLYSLRLNNNGKVTGFGINSDTNQNTEFAILADRFIISHDGSDIYPFQVVGGKVFMRNVQIDNANIDDLTIKGEKLVTNAVSILNQFSYLPNYDQRDGLNTSWGNYMSASVVASNVPANTVVRMDIACECSGGKDGKSLYWRVVRSDGVYLNEVRMTVPDEDSSVQCWFWLDTVPGAGSYTYTLQGKTDSGGRYRNMRFVGIVYKR